MEGAMLPSTPSSDPISPFPQCFLTLGFGIKRPGLLRPKMKFQARLELSSPIADDKERKRPFLKWGSYE